MDHHPGPIAAGPAAFRRRSPRRPGRRAQGTATLWLILLLPVLLIMLLIVVEIGHLALVRGQLEDSLEASAQAAVLNWYAGGGGDTTAARTAAQDFARFNPIGRNQTVSLQLNDDGSGPNPNDNQALTGSNAQLIFGRATQSGTNYTFEANVEPQVSPGTIRIIASGNFANASSADDFLQIEFLSAHPGTTVIREVWIDLRSGTEPGNDALFFADTPVTSASLPSMLPNTTTVNSGTPPTSGNQITGVLLSLLGGQVLRIVPPSGSFVAATPANTLRLAGLRVGPGPIFGQGILGSGSASGDGDAFGVYGIGGQVVVQRNPPAGPLTTIPFTFVDNLLNDDRSEVSFAAGTSSDIFAVRSAIAANVPSLIANLAGVPLGPFQVRADAVAIYDPAATGTRIRTIRVDQFLPASIANSP